MSIFLTNSAAPGNKIIFTNSGSGNKTYLTITPITPLHVTINNLFPDWSTRIYSSANFNNISDLVAETNGNVYVTGSYGAICTFYNASGTSSGTMAQTTANLQDGYIAKYNSSGTVEWKAHIGNRAELVCMAVDPGANVYVSGNFSNTTVTVFNSSGTSFGTISNIGSSGTVNAPLVKYNTSGSVVWTAKQGSSADLTRVYGMASDAGSNVYVGGVFSLYTPFEIYNSTASGGTLFGYAPSSIGNSDGWFVKYDTAGAVQWVGHTFSGDGISTYGDAPINVIGVSPVDASVIVGGYYTEFTLTIEPPNLGASTTLPNSGVQDGMILKFNAAGAIQWKTRLTNVVDVRSISVNSSGDIFVAGNYFNSNVLTIYSANGIGTPTLYGTLSNSGNGSVFLIKYNSSGVVQWATRIDGGGTDECRRSVVFDSIGNIYVGGISDSDPMTIYNANGTSFGTTFSNGGIGFGFVVAYNSSGIAQYASKILTSTGAFPTPNGMAVDSSGGVYVGGSYLNTMTLYNSNGTTYGTMAGDPTYFNGFVIKY